MHLSRFAWQKPSAPKTLPCLSTCKIPIIMECVWSIIPFLVRFLVMEFTDLGRKNSQSQTACTCRMCKNTDYISARVHNCVKLDEWYSLVHYEINILFGNDKAFTFPNHSTHTHTHTHTAAIPRNMGEETLGGKNTMFFNLLATCTSTHILSGLFCFPSYCYTLPWKAIPLTLCNLSLWCSNSKLFPSLLEHSLSSILSCSGIFQFLTY